MITLDIKDGPSFQVPWTAKMNLQDALEWAFNNRGTINFTYSLQYFGSNLGYLVCMINETFDSTVSNYNYTPYYFWDIIVNNVSATTGIDHILLNDGDAVEFSFILYQPTVHLQSTLSVKFNKMPN